MKISDNNTPLPDGVWMVRFHNLSNTSKDVVFSVIGSEVKVLKSNYWIFEVGDNWIFEVGDIETNIGWKGVECTKFSVKTYYEITSKS